MSTIVAVVKNNIACIAADSLTSFGETKQAAQYVSDYEKIIEFADRNYIGIVGSAAHHLVMQNLFEKHAEKIDFSDRFSIFETMRQLHPILKDEYYLNSKDEDDDSYESSRVDALVMNRNGIFGLYALREVDQYTRFWAVGSGAGFALGAMQVAYELLDDATAIARAGIEAGASFDTGSALPMSLYSLELN
ncbi:MAG: MFS transporter [Gammaproteobacteria bacterium]|nr:MFS transporter [Gammaproteobacteria bacterium]MDH3448519.1 MFS transporter [Gammaproteobacteria bacterium]